MKKLFRVAMAALIPTTMFASGMIFGTLCFMGLVSWISGVNPGPPPPMFLRLAMVLIAFIWFWNAFVIYHLNRSLK